jgi:hypothetical protein
MLVPNVDKNTPLIQRTGMLARSVLRGIPAKEIAALGAR